MANLLCLAVEKKNAERARQLLIAQDALDSARKPTSDSKFVYFPIKNKLDIGLGKLVSKKLKPRKFKPHSLEEAMKGKIPAAKIHLLPRAFDMIGDVAIIEIPRPLATNAKLMGKSLLAIHPNLKSVYAKGGKRTGKYRTRKLVHLAGEKRTTTIHKENGCDFELDIAKAYFSPRLAHERQIIANAAKPGEKILALFAGVGPFPIVLAKHQPSVQIAAIELNPQAAKYLANNIRRNSMGGIIEPIKGDAHAVVRKRFKKWADRILMPYPNAAHQFLSDAFYAAKPGCAVHFYCFAREERAFAEAEAIVQKAAAKARRKIEILGKRTVLPYAPRVVQVAIDFCVLS
ncbi:MAG: class I SAM-dependent methyltransferase family protein [Candidatus Burarchaeum sp.]|nr:class I SAM-dependent methyltransferase family protein [Candidatus Burarchaeum sp.]MDO8339064.1 class I SAM-dependent methyltransferase family protein [Candidatus Burarchaeum sp.]